MLISYTACAHEHTNCMQLLTHNYHKKVFTALTAGSINLTGTTCVGTSAVGLDERPDLQGGCGQCGVNVTGTVWGSVRVPCHRPGVGEASTGSLCHTGEGEDTACCELIRTQFPWVLPRD